MKQPALVHFFGYILLQSVSYKLNKFRELINTLHISVCKKCKNFNLQGVANRGCSIRVGRETEKQGKGTASAAVLQQFFLRTKTEDNCKFNFYRILNSKKTRVCNSLSDAETKIIYVLFKLSYRLKQKTNT